MNDRPIQLYSGVKSQLKKDILFRGSLLSILGIALWVITGAILPSPLLSTWGIPIFFVGGSLIALGLVPYKRLTSLETHPFHLSLHADGTIILSRKGKVRCTITVDMIERVSFHEAPGVVGILVWFKAGVQGQPSWKRYGADLFLPYFGKHAYNTFVDIVKTPC